MKNIITIVTLLICSISVNAQVALSDIRNLQKEYEKLGVKINVEHINDMKYIERYRFDMPKYNINPNHDGVDKEENERILQNGLKEGSSFCLEVANSDELRKLAMNAINLVQKKATDINRWEYHKNGHDTINCTMTFAKDKPNKCINVSEDIFWWDVYDIPEYLVVHYTDRDTILWDCHRTGVNVGYEGSGSLIYVCTLDSAKRGTQPLNVKEYLKSVDKAFDCQGVEKHPVEYEHSGNMQPDGHQLIMQMYSDRPKQSKSVGTVYCMKDKSVADKVTKEMEKCTKAYFDAHPETRYTYFSNMECDEGHPLFKVECEMGNINGVPERFSIFTAAIASDKYYILLLHTIGEEWIPNDLTIKSYKNGKIEYFDKAK